MCVYEKVVGSIEVGREGHNARNHYSKRCGVDLVGTFSQFSILTGGLFEGISNSK